VPAWSVNSVVPLSKETCLVKNLNFTPQTATYHNSSPHCTDETYFISHTPSIGTEGGHIISPSNHHKLPKTCPLFKRKISPKCSFSSFLIIKTRFPTTIKRQNSFPFVQTLSWRRSFEIGINILQGLTTNEVGPSTDFTGNAFRARKLLAHALSKEDSGLAVELA
jgi:hypothetical protein